MADISHLLPEIIFSSKDPNISRQISKWVSDGTLKKIAPRVYTSRIQEKPHDIIRRNLFTILGSLYPGILLSHRSALEFEPTQTGHLFLTYSHPRKLMLGDIKLDIMMGRGPIAGDNPLSGGLYASQLERALLENLQQSRKPGSDSKTLTIPEIEDRLEQIVRVRGENGLNEFRDKARLIGKSLGMEKEFDKLNKLVGALLSTNPAHILSSPRAIARNLGSPYDPERLQVFKKLFLALQQPFQDVPEQNNSQAAFRNFAFFEAYFSNYIEGTEFQVEEAKQIIRTGNPLPARDQDSHDILGTYKILSDQTGMKITPGDPEELFQILQYRHQLLLSARPEAHPGHFKHINNRAGSTEFVDHTLVRGTLIKGFDYYLNLQHPFAKAIYLKFLITEVHPFLDGNGRIARVMMNAELVKAEQTRIIIPTVFREDYIGAIRQLSRQEKPAAYIRMLSRAQEFSATIVGNNMDGMQQRLEAANAFLEPAEGKLQIIVPDAPEEERRPGRKR